MDIQEKHRYHGAALTQIVEYRRFKALNKAPYKKYGHYTVNEDRRLFVKYRTHSKPPWQFTFAPDEIKAIQIDMEAKLPTFVCLVCGKRSVCCLNGDEVSDLVNFKASAAQSIKVEIPKGGSLHVSGPKKRKLNHTIPRNAFPAKVFK